AAEWRELSSKNRKACGFHGTAAPPDVPDPFGLNPHLPRANVGTRVIDISDPSKPYNTTYLTSPAMLDPWESLKANKRRNLLGAVNGTGGAGGPQFDVYDISGDCRYPQLLSSTVIALLDAGPALFGHEGSWAPDGLTYYS